MYDWQSLHDVTLWIRCDHRATEIKVNYVVPRHRHLSLPRMCRRHSRLTLHAGLITVSDSQTAPRTLKMSVWNLRVCKLPIIPSILGKIKGLMICKWRGKGRFFSSFCDLMMRVALNENKSPRAAFLHFWRGGEPEFQMKASRPHTGQLCTPACREARCLCCLCKVKNTRVTTKWGKRAGSLIETAWQPCHLILDRWPLAPVSVTTSKPTLRPPSLTSSV